MSMIQAIEEAEVEQVFAPKSKGPSARTLRTREFEEDAKDIAAIAHRGKAAEVAFDTDQVEPTVFVNGIRAALKRLEEDDILVQRKRNSNIIVAWERRPEDEDRIAKRIETGRRLGMMAHARAEKNSKGKKPQPMTAKRRAS